TGAISRRAVDHALEKIGRARDRTIGCAGDGHRSAIAVCGVAALRLSERTLAGPLQEPCRSLRPRGPRKGFGILLPRASEAHDERNTIRRDSGQPSAPNPLSAVSDECHNG